MTMPAMKRIPDDVAEPWHGKEEPPLFKGMRLAAEKIRNTKFAIYTLISLLGTVNGLVLATLTPAIVWVIALVTAAVMLSYFMWRAYKAHTSYEQHQRDHQKPLVIVRDSNPNKAA